MKYSSSSKAPPPAMIGSNRSIGSISTPSGATTVSTATPSVVLSTNTVTSQWWCRCSSSRYA